MSGTDDEIFDESEGAEKVLAQGQVDRVSDALYMSGFRQGLSDGQESERTLQDSFDSGYRASFQVFKEIGTVRAALAVALATLEGQDARSDDEKMIQDLYVKATRTHEKMSKDMDNESKFGAEVNWNEYKIDELKARADALLEEMGYKKRDCAAETAAER